MQPTPFDIPADLDTPVSAYLKLRPFSPRFLLESVEQGQHLGRYSFIGFGEARDFRLRGGRMFIDGEPMAIDSDTEILDVLRQALELAPRPGPEIPGVPFSGGLVGVTHYETVGEFERLPFSRNLSEAQDDSLQANYIAPRSILVFDHLTRRIALLHDGSEAERQSLRREVIQALHGPVPTPAVIRRAASPTASLSTPDFLAAVERAQGDISAGEIYQLVLSVAFEGECEIDPFQVYRALRLLNPSPYLYFFDFGDLAVAGSSPEALVRVNGREASLRPIAGTRPRGESEVEDLRLEQELLADPKEAAEHVMLVDLARNDLGRVAVTGSVSVSPYRSIERYSHVMHIVSGVRGVLAPGRDTFDLFASSFPAGTVVGAPKIRAMERIHALEPGPRGVYAGTAGYFGHGGVMDQAIAIRTLTFEKGRYRYQAGAGIVSDSQPEREYDEVLAKSSVLRSAIELAGEGL